MDAWCIRPPVNASIDDTVTSSPDQSAPRKGCQLGDAIGDALFCSNIDLPDWNGFSHSALARDNCNCSRDWRKRLALSGLDRFTLRMAPPPLHVLTEAERK